MVLLKVNGALASTCNLNDIKNNKLKMRRKKVEVLNENNLWDSEIIKIGNREGNYYFEIITEQTNDIGEAVAMMMRLKNKWNDPVWDMKIENINYYDIEPSKAIYWLSGGDDEWRWGTTYKKNWNECSYEFQSEFGMTIISIIKNSKTLKDIRNGFKNHINIMELYEFAIENKIV